MSAVAAWITDNFDTIINWIITIAAVIFPFFIPSPDKERVVAGKNLFAGYSAFLVKATSYYLLCVLISQTIGRCASVPAITIVLIILGGVLCVSGGSRWSNQMNMLKSGKKHGKCWTKAFVIIPVVLQCVLYLGFLSGWWMPRGWVVGWVIGNLLPIVLAALLIEDHDFFEYQQVDIFLVGDNESYAFCPEAIVDGVAQITVNREDEEKITRLSVENIKKIEYDISSGHRASKAMSRGDKLFRAMLCLCYMLMIGVVSQFLLGSVVKQIAVPEDEINLEQGDTYQLGAVALNEKAGELRYSITGSSAITVSEKGMITVISGVPEEKEMTATITISDEIGNTVDVRVIVKNDASGK